MSDSESPRNTVVTIVIPTFNGERYMESILTSIEGQLFDGYVETLVIDSGSTDATLSIVSAHPGVRLVEIPNSEFGHGKTRNLAAQLANGEFVVYLTHDAIPATERWLYELLKPFELNDSVVAVMGRQAPRRTCFPLLKYEITAVFAGLGPSFGSSYFYGDYFTESRAVRDAAAFYSDVNSAARRSFLLDVAPYRDVPYAEDQIFGRDVIDKGYLKVYAPRAVVEHSNDLTLSEYDNRLYDETVGLRSVGIDVDVPSIRAAARMAVTGAARDTIRIMRDPDYSRKRKAYYLAVNPLFHVQKWRGVRAGALAPVDDPDSGARRSLEARRRAT